MRRTPRTDRRQSPITFHQSPLTTSLPSPAFELAIKVAEALSHMLGEIGLKLLVKSKRRVFLLFLDRDELAAGGVGPVFVRHIV